MMHKLKYLQLAKQDIHAIVLYISDTLNAPKAALDLMNALDEAISRLEQFPYAYRIYQAVNQLEHEYRLMPVNNYAVFYIVNEVKHVVEIHRVIYAMMDLEKIIMDAL
jgi:plasmid stabilization system protein ParE